MKGLLYKEWATLTSSYKQTVFFIAFLYGGISILTGQTGMAYALLVVFSILITSTISFDENSHWDIYARTLPVTPAQLVGSKYLFGLCGLALGTVCTVLIVALNQCAPPLLFWHTVYKVPPLECLQPCWPAAAWRCCWSRFCCRCPIGSTVSRPAAGCF